MSTMTDKDVGRDEPPGQDDRVTLLDTMKSIGWAFFGVRGRGGHERDVSRFKPAHVIGAALFGAFLFVMVLILVIASVT